MNIMRRRNEIVLADKWKLDALARTRGTNLTQLARQLGRSDQYIHNLFKTYGGITKEVALFLTKEWGIDPSQYAPVEEDFKVSLTLTPDIKKELANVIGSGVLAAMRKAKEEGLL